MTDQSTIRGATRTKRIMSVEQAINWAFGSECASIDFKEEIDPDSYRGSGSPDSAWRILQRGILGCPIDGSRGGSFGGSMPHQDAEMIASQVAALSQGSGGKGMATQIASLARTGSRPDWMPGARQRCVPRDWKMTKHGNFAKTEVIGTIEHVWRGRKTKRQIVACPVTYVPSQQQIAASRRNYLDWWGALLEIGSALRAMEILTSIDLTSRMPPMTPWRGGCGPS